MTERSEQTFNQTGAINDLTVTADQADAITGGPQLYLPAIQSVRDAANK